MTGFGKASAQIDDKTVNVEIKSLNSQKGLDLNVKLPSKYRAFEYELRNKLTALLQRGKVDVFISLEHNTASSEISLNRELIISYFNEFKSIANEVGVSTERLLPTAFWLGAALMLVVDDLARTLTQAEIPIGIITALLGAPLFTFLLVQSRRRSTAR